MKLYLLIVALCSATSLAVAQAPTPTPNPTPNPTQTEPSVNSSGGPGLPPANPNLFKAKAADSYVRPDAETRRKRFIKSTVGPFALGRAVVSAGISTWKNSPEEWGPTWEGFGRRVASKLGKNAIKQTTKFGLDEALKIDSHFYRSKSTKVGDRIRNAIISPVTARDRNGKRVFGFSNIAATYTSSIVAYEAWYPARYGWKNGVRSGTISLGFNAAFNLFKEFVRKK